MGKVLSVASVRVTKLLKFALVGCSGSGLNLCLFFLLVDREGMDPTAGAVICFVVAVTWNYFLNSAWTFRAHVKGERPSPGRYFRFVAWDSPEVASVPRRKPMHDQ